MQATLAALPLDQVNSKIPRSSPDYAKNQRWAEDALVTSIFCIIICGTLGTILIRWLAPYLLEKVRPSVLFQSGTRGNGSGEGTRRDS